MADVASEASDGLVGAVEGCRASAATGAACDGEDMAVEDGVDGKVSIHEILEGMTNEFNKGVSPTKHADNADKTVAVIEEPTMTPSPSPSKVVDEGSKGEKERDSVSEEAIATLEDIMMVQSAPEENHRGEEEGSAGKQEAVKKDNGIPRIVLTFRTIDENTDHGKKTKISSCSSNLTLVPDELVNCDQIGGVSVKIENSDDNSDAVEETHTEEVRKEKEVAKEVVEQKTIVEDKVEDTIEKLDNAQPAVEEKAETVQNNSKSNNAETTEGTEQQETTAPVTRKRRIGRPRLRALRFLVFSYFASSRS